MLKATTFETAFVTHGTGQGSKMSALLKRWTSPLFKEHILDISANTTDMEMKMIEKPNLQSPPISL
jgi:hypothetical protein